MPKRPKRMDAFISENDAGLVRFKSVEAYRDWQKANEEVKEAKRRLEREESKSKVGGADDADGN